MLTAGVSAFKVLSLKFRKYRFNDISYIIKKRAARIGIAQIRRLLKESLQLFVLIPPRW